MFVFGLRLSRPQVRRFSETPKPKHGSSIDITKQKPEESIFAKIVAKKIPAEILYEDDKAMCIRDVKPVAPTHLLIIPKKPIGGISVLQKEDNEVVGHCMFVASHVAAKEGLTKGYRLVINEGKHGQQSVRWLHIHLIGGKQLGWPPSSEE